MKFLVTGSARLVGSQVVKDLAKQNHEVYSCYCNSKPEHGIATKLDLTNQDTLRDTINKIKPDSIIHLAAMTGVDQCEEKPELAMTINAKINLTVLYRNLQKRTIQNYSV